MLSNFRRLKFVLKKSRWRRRRSVAARKFILDRLDER